MELDEERLGNWLQRFGVNAPECKPRYVHASGHASGPELIDFVKGIRPKMLIPIHTHRPDMFEQELAGTGIAVHVPRVGEAIPIP